MPNKIQNDFYKGIESGVRPWVKLLRDAGINTDSSCHHEGTICFFPFDIRSDLGTVRRLFKGRIKEYTLTFVYAQFEERVYRELVIIKSPRFKQKYVSGYTNVAKAVLRNSSSISRFNPEC